MTDKSKKQKRPSGPEPERLKIEDDWRDAMGKAIKKRRPKDGWPEDGEKEGKTKKTPD